VGWFDPTTCCPGVVRRKQLSPARCLTQSHVKLCRQRPVVLADQLFYWKPCGCQQVLCRAGPVRGARSSVCTAQSGWSAVVGPVRGGGNNWTSSSASKGTGPGLGVAGKRSEVCRAGADARKGLRAILRTDRPQSFLEANTSRIYAWITAPNGPSLRKECRLIVEFSCVAAWPGCVRMAVGSCPELVE